MGTLVISIDIPSGGQPESGGHGYQASVIGLFDSPPVIPGADRGPSPDAGTGPSHPPANAADLRAFRVWGLSTLERAVFTFAASFLSALTLGGAFSIPALDVALFAAATAAISVVTAAIRSLTPPTSSKSLDVVTRVGLTLLQAFAAAFVTSTAGATHLSDWRAGALAGLAAAFTALKGTLAVQLNGDKAANGERPTPASLMPLRPAANTTTLVTSQATA